MHISRIPCFLRWVVAVWLAMFCLVAQGKVFLVSVGIADYPGKSHDLQSSSADAATIQNIYDKNGKAQTVLCLNTEATIQQVCNLMELTFSCATESDVITFYFSGHGAS